MLDSVGFVTMRDAKRVINKYHYSKVLPRITKLCVGGWKDNQLVAVCTLGYGVRPLHTLKKMFPTLEVADYLEIGKLCVADECPRNTESYFIGKVIKLIKQHVPRLKVLYSWSDGIIGKPGYVYQASNFFYGGFIWTEMYLSPVGVRVHARTMQGLSTTAGSGKFNSRAYEVTTAMGFTKYFGLQFRYMFPMCGKFATKSLLRDSPFPWVRGGYPKDADCLWKVQVAKGIREDCGKPPFVETTYSEPKRTAQAGLFQ